LTETDENASQFWLGYVQPFTQFDGDGLMRLPAGQ
jgi:hypothetical protein